VGLVFGALLGLPIARSVVALVAHPSSAGLSAAQAPGPQATPAASPTPRPSASASLSPAASGSAATAPTCSPLAAGQPPLTALEVPPVSYRADPTLSWVGCGDSSLPSASASFTLAGPWLLAISYSCPAGTTAASTDPTLAVLEPLEPPGSGQVSLASERADSADLIAGGLGGTGFAAGAHRLVVEAPAACLWHLAVYPAAGS
jgi:hypothetical protein